jgi:uncharacterized membrane-anchored protein
MFHRKLFLLMIGAAALICATAIAQDQPTKPKLNVLKGPATAKLGGVAQINLPAGYNFLDGATTRSILKAYGEPVSGKELGLIEATNAHWSVMFEFADIGYVKDDDKDKLDADKMLAGFKEGTAEQNKQRVAMGRPPLEIVGWEQPPHYDETTHNLTWAIRCTSEGRQILNYNTRRLGRLGVMEVVLICEPDQLQGTLPTFTSLLAGYSFQTGNNYAEYRKGDKVAKYGLAALVLGGAAVGAAKLGLLAWLLPFLKKGWILIVAAFAGIANFFRKLFGKKTGRKDDDHSS